MKFLALCLALLGGCAHAPQAAKPVTAHVELGIPKLTPPDISKVLAQLDAEEHKETSTEDVCEGSKPCVVHVVLNEEVTDDSMKVALEKLEAAHKVKAKAYVLEINSPGGDVEAGWRLAKSIEAAQIKVVCVVDGEAASMASYILQSCPVREMTKRSVQMYHERAMGAMFQGQPNQWAAIAAHMEAWRQADAEHNVHRMKISAEEYRKHTDGGQQWWLDWKQAVEVGAVDEVVDSIEAVLKNP